MSRIANGEVLVGVIASTMMILACRSPGQLDGTGGVKGCGGRGAGGLTVNLTDQGGALGSGDGGGAPGAGGTTALAEGTCGETIITPNQAPVDVLIVLDRSDSMGYSMTGDCYCTLTPATAQLGALCDPVPPSCVDRWSVVSAAVAQTIAAHPQINWGLNLFSAPSSPACSVSLVPQVAIGAKSGLQIQSLLASMDLQLWTPTALAVNAGRMYLDTVDDGNDKAILLATDGEPNCRGGNASSTDVPGTETAIKNALSAGFKTYVIGIGPSVGNLDNFAVAGGTGQYYPASSPADLATALAAIASTVANCTFTVSVPAGADPKNVGVFLDKSRVPEDSANGWSYGGNNTTIVLNGTTCEKIKSGAASTVQVFFGCPGQEIPIFIP